MSGEFDGFIEQQRARGIPVTPELIEVNKMPKEEPYHLYKAPKWHWVVVAPFLIAAILLYLLWGTVISVLFSLPQWICGDGKFIDLFKYNFPKD